MPLSDLICSCPKQEPRLGLVRLAAHDVTLAQVEKLRHLWRLYCPACGIEDIHERPALRGIIAVYFVDEIATLAHFRDDLFVQGDDRRIGIEPKLDFLFRVAALPFLTTRERRGRGHYCLAECFRLRVVFSSMHTQCQLNYPCRYC